MDKEAILKKLKFGNRTVSQIAIDETWSALRGRDPELVGKLIF